MDQNGKGKHKQKFFKKYDTITDKDYKLEMLWSQRIIQGKLHRIRLNITRTDIMDCCYFYCDRDIGYYSTVL